MLQPVQRRTGPQTGREGAPSRGRVYKTRNGREGIERWGRGRTDRSSVNHAVYVPHTAGRYAKKQFAKGRMPIVERLVNA